MSQPPNTDTADDDRFEDVGFLETNAFRKLNDLPENNAFRRGSYESLEKSLRTAFMDHTLRGKEIFILGNSGVGKSVFFSYVLSKTAGKLLTPKALLPQTSPNKKTVVYRCYHLIYILLRSRSVVSEMRSKDSQEIYHGVYIFRSDNLWTANKPPRAQIIVITLKIPTPYEKLTLSTPLSKCVLTVYDLDETNDVLTESENTEVCLSEIKYASDETTVSVFLDSHDKLHSCDSATEHGRKCGTLYCRDICNGTIPTNTLVIPQLQPASENVTLTCSSPGAMRAQSDPGITVQSSGNSNLSYNFYMPHWNVEELTTVMQRRVQRQWDIDVDIDQPMSDRVKKDIALAVECAERVFGGVIRFFLEDLFQQLIVNQWLYLKYPLEHSNKEVDVFLASIDSACRTRVAGYVRAGTNGTFKGMLDTIRCIGNLPQVTTTLPTNQMQVVDLLFKFEDKFDKQPALTEIDHVPKMIINTQAIASIVIDVWTSHGNGKLLYDIFISGQHGFAHWKTNRNLPRIFEAFTIWRLRKPYALSRLLQLKAYKIDGNTSTSCRTCPIFSDTTGINSINALTVSSATPGTLTLKGSGDNKRIELPSGELQLNTLYDTAHNCPVIDGLLVSEFVVSVDKNETTAFLIQLTTSDKHNALPIYLEKLVKLLNEKFGDQLSFVYLLMSPFWIPKFNITAADLQVMSTLKIRPFFVFISSLFLTGSTDKSAVDHASSILTMCESVKDPSVASVMEKRTWGQTPSNEDDYDEDDYDHSGLVTPRFFLTFNSSQSQETPQQEIQVETDPATGSNTAVSRRSPLACYSSLTLNSSKRSVSLDSVPPQPSKKICEREQFD